MPGRPILLPLKISDFARKFPEEIPVRNDLTCKIQMTKDLLEFCGIGLAACLLESGRR
jgi:hypothetical protein